MTLFYKTYGNFFYSGCECQLACEIDISTDSELNSEALSAQRFLHKRKPTPIPSSLLLLSLSLSLSLSFSLILSVFLKRGLGEQKKAMRKI